MVITLAFIVAAVLVLALRALPRDASCAGQRALGAIDAWETDLSGEPDPVVVGLY